MTDTKDKKTDAVEPTAIVQAQPAAPVVIARRDAEIPAVITTKVEYDKVYAMLRAKFNVLTPMASFSGMAIQHGLVVTKVEIDPDPDHGEVYQDKLFCKPDEVALSKVGLRRLAIAGGWSLSAQVLKAEQHYWLIQATLEFTGIDGAPQRLQATEEYDLRDGSPQIAKMSPAQLAGARSHGLRSAEARALNAAVREYGIRQKYTKKELEERPFIMMRMMFMPDANDPNQMRMVAERALGAKAAMYPAPAPPPTQLAPVHDIDRHEDGRREIDRGTIDAQTVPAVPDGYVMVVSIRDTPIKKRDGTGTFPKYTVITSDGVEHMTIKSPIHAAVAACWNKDDWKMGRPVSILSDTNQYGDNEIQEVTPFTK